MKKIVFCRAPWEQVSINLSGEIRTCCWANRIARKKLCYSNLERVWRRSFEKYRKYIRRGKYSPYCDCERMRGGVIHFLKDKEINEDNIFINKYIVNNLPKVMELEVTTKCNLKCVQCLEHSVHGIPENHLPIKAFKNIKPLMKELRNITLHGVGEFFMYKHWKELLEMLPKGIKTVQFNTNGTLLTQENIEIIKNSPVTEISVSLDAGKKETYEAIRGGKFQKVIENVRNLKKICDNKLTVCLNMTLMKLNIKEVPEFVKLAKSLEIDSVVVWLINNEEYSEPIKRKDFTFVYNEQKKFTKDELKYVGKGILLAKQLNIPFFNHTGIPDQILIDYN